MKKEIKSIIKNSNKKKKETIANNTKHTGSICLLVVVSMVSLMFYSMYRSSGTRFEQFFVAMLFVVGVLPILIACSLTYFISLAKSKEVKPKESAKVNNNINGEKVETKTKKSGKIPSTEGYIETRDLFKFASQKGRLSMENYFEIKDFIKARLCDNYKPYEAIQWKNDSHCIYSTLKSSKLTTEDYRAICELIHDLMGTEEYTKEIENSINTVGGQ